MSGHSGAGVKPSIRWKVVVAPLVSEKVLRWLMFGVAFATLPLLLNLLLAMTRDLQVGWVQLFGQGELLLVSAGVAASGAGELSGETVTALRRFQIFLSGSAYIIVCLSSVWFAGTATLRAADQKVDEVVVANGSLLVFTCAIVTGASCVALSKVRT